MTNETITENREEKTNNGKDFNQLYYNMLSARHEEARYIKKLAEMQGCPEATQEVLEKCNSRIKAALRMSWRTDCQYDDFQNRRKIEGTGENDAAREKVINDPVGRKVQDVANLAYQIWDSNLIDGHRPSIRYIFHNKRKALHAYEVAEEIFRKMIYRTITELEYNHILNSSPKQLRKEWGRK